MTNDYHELGNTSSWSHLFGLLVEVDNGDKYGLHLSLGDGDGYA